ncbi:MAG: hypothetical protein JWN23_1047 [Rhodocyclales bacterium]|nr:hypothetical protein [Rhodocyclales bacterium]
MWRFLYIIYAIVVTVATTSLNGIANGRGSSYRSWGGSSYGSGYSGGGSFHK